MERFTISKSEHTPGDDGKENEEENKMYSESYQDQSADHQQQQQYEGDDHVLKREQVTLYDG